MWHELIHQEDGSLDWTAIKRHALTRAQRQFGGQNPPSTYIRPELRALKDGAMIMRKRWREAHGLPDDTVYVTIEAYGRPVEGVRMSRF